MKADREYKKQQTRIIQSVENRKAKVAVPQGADRNNTTTAQLFAIPQGLHDIIDDVTKVQNDIKTTGSTATPLYGSEEWARDTRWATLRKLDEWFLVKELYRQSTPEVNSQNSIIGFGIDDTYESDGLIMSNENKEYVWAGENKLITGNFPQISENINNALSQLCSGIRAQSYSGGNLVARIVVHPSSMAASRLKEMTDTQKKSMRTRWLNRAIIYYREGVKNNWSMATRLQLQINVGEKVIYQVNIDKPGQNIEYNVLTPDLWYL